MNGFRVPLRGWIESAVAWMRDVLAPVFDVFGDAIGLVVSRLLAALSLLPPLWMIGVVAVAVAFVIGWRAGLFALAGLLLIENIGLWRPFLQTLSLVLTAQLLIVLVGLPLGIAAASSNAVDRALRPVLDFMQTMPAFVYLIPAVMFFGIGTVPGVVATFVFGLPPLVRLVNLGIRQVPRELIEAADAFGSTAWQKLVKVQMPVAAPTVMAGLNQSIMLNLSMIVVASMIGAQGLGTEVLRGIQRIQVGQGFEAGLAVVILAVLLDRLTGAFGSRRSVREG